MLATSGIQCSKTKEPPPAVARLFITSTACSTGAAFLDASAKNHGKSSGPAFTGDPICLRSTRSWATRVGPRRAKRGSKVAPLPVMAGRMLSKCTDSIKSGRSDAVPLASGGGHQSIKAPLSISIFSLNKRRKTRGMIRQQRLSLVSRLTAAVCLNRLLFRSLH